MSKIFYALLLIIAVSIELLTFAKILSANTPKIDVVHSENTEIIQKEEKPITIILTGDVMLGRSVMTTTLDSGSNTYPFLHVADVLRAAHLVFSNLENPITENCPRKDSGMIFCADPKMIEGLTFAGIDVVNIANNHTLNYGKKGFEETKKFLTDSDIQYTGDSNVVIKEIEGTKFGFMGFDYVTGNPKEADFKMIQEADHMVDVLIIGVHWGSEYQSKAGKFQEKTAKEMIDNGADVIAGHHPHWVQNDEFYNGKPIYYSLGNFIFDQMWSENTKKGMAVKLSFMNQQFFSEEKLPVHIQTLGQPSWVSAL